jgi:hypothetical protein
MLTTQILLEKIRVTYIQRLRATLHKGALPPDPGVVAQPPAESLPNPAPQFRLQKICQLEAFLRSEVEGRSTLYKNYHRAVKFLDGTCAALGSCVCVVIGAVGTGL